MSTTKEMLENALRHHQAGQLDVAENIYRSILAEEPQHADTLHLLGVLLMGKGEYANAVRLMEQAIGQRADNPHYHFNRGLALYHLGRSEEAIDSWKSTLRLNPAYTDAWNRIGMARKRQGLLEKAEKCYQQAIASNPEFFAAHYNLGNLYQERQELGMAIEAYQRALTLDDRHAQCWINLGVCQQSLGHLSDALSSYRRASALDPLHASAHHNLGNLLLEMERQEEAVEYLQRALHLRPDDPDTLNNLGLSYWQLGDIQRALETFQMALKQAPHAADIHNNLGLAQQNAGQLDQALEHYRRALALQPDFMEARSNLLFLLSYNVLCGPQEMLDAHREWDRIHGGPRKAATFARKHTPRRKPPLRIGYVSPDFRQHAVSYFFEPILGNHDPSQVEVFCYAEVKNPDAVTQRLQGLAHHWRSSVGLSDAQLAQRIFDDRIDVLVDLAGHTAGHRLGAFAYKPAPVQATYLGYFTTTGLETMDYWISDQILHPDDTCELATETIYRLPRCCLVYQPPVDAPPVAHRDPAQPIVFGSFNQIAKTSPQAVRLWAQVLRAVPNSRLLIKTNQLADSAVRDQLRAQFQQQGIDPQRLILRQRTAAHRDHLATYGEVDIALDTVPRTGGSTTADALWMGVPIVSLAGPRFIQRLSASMLHAVGLEELVAHSEQRYVDTAVSLARDHQRRQQLRAALRQRMAQSPLCNARDLAHALEKAFADMLEKSRHRAEHAP